jgi:predicted transcriptional regulator of viral defense system
MCQFMVMSSDAKIPAELQKAPFSARQAESHGITRHYLRKMVREGAIESLCRGVYRVPQPDYSEEDQFRSALLRLGEPSAICLVSALAFYHLIDAIPNKVWVMVPFEKRTVCADIKVLRVRNPHWKRGIVTLDGYRITSLERSIVDAFTYARSIGVQMGLEALKTSTRQKKTTFGAVLDMAKSLGADEKVRPYIEALS